uniref:Cation-transporting P-type ATPase C-terminal domain-containing protein n=1 Tax=Acrobeloides nanus TaxID=290746 RepID=A0A914D1H2_9BILA
MDKQIFASEIVVGDIIRIQSGVRVPADARILQCNQLKLETSSITGEPEPLDYHEEEVPENINIFESKNVAFNSSLCVDGEGVGVVIRTGINTVIGQIAELTTSQPVKKSRLEMQIRLYIRFLLVAALAVGSSVFLMGGTIHHWENIPMLLATSYAVCAVGMVPEGLPATVTSILTVIARRLEKKNVYLKRLDIVEALGSASIIATDKTGTLTKNVMTVTDVWYNNEVISGLPKGNESTFINTSPKSLERFAAPLYGIFLGMIVCNKATFGKDDKTQDAVRVEMPHQKSQNTDETPAAIRMCREAGIKVFMVTGDHHTTAKAIAQQIGLIDDKPRNQIDWEIVYGEEIPHLTDKDWDRLIARNSLVFSRTTPEQKLLIVEQCQKRKQIIAMTGDGVNDAPALKKSDIGVGMGSGSDVAKQAADIILTDDNFASIVAAIQEGRLMFDNIKKLMSYILTHLVPEVWGILVHYCFGMPIGQTSLQILSIDLGTEIPPGIAMCKEPAEDDIMVPPWHSYKKFYHNGTLPKAISSVRPEIYSFKLTPECDPTPIQRSIMRVQLYDNRKLYVAKLDLVWKDRCKDEFHCLGNGQKITGSPHYCDGHPHEPTGNRFCFYRQPPGVVMIIGGVNELIGGVPIPGDISTSPRTTRNEKSVPLATHATPNAIQKGLNLTFDKGTQVAEISTNGYFSLSRTAHFGSPPK